MPQEKIPLLVIGGPTASGKTRLAAELALHCGGEVVSADSMQIYRGMEIGTAKPTPEETLGVPHHLMDFVEPGQSFSVADYVALARETVGDIHSRGRLPVLAGPLYSLADHEHTVYRSRQRPRSARGAGTAGGAGGNRCPHA